MKYNETAFVVCRMWHEFWIQNVYKFIMKRGWASSL